MPYSSHLHCFHIHKAKRYITLLFLNDSGNFNNGDKTRSDILNERLTPEPNLLLTVSRLHDTHYKRLMKETDFLTFIS